MFSLEMENYHKPVFIFLQVLNDLYAKAATLANYKIADYFDIYAFKWWVSLFKKSQLIDMLNWDHPSNFFCYNRWTSFEIYGNIAQ